MRALAATRRELPVPKPVRMTDCHLPIVDDVHVRLEPASPASRRLPASAQFTTRYPSISERGPYCGSIRSAFQGCRLWLNVAPDAMGRLRPANSSLVFPALKGTNSKTRGEALHSPGFRATQTEKSPERARPPLCGSWFGFVKGAGKQASDTRFRTPDVKTREYEQRSLPGITRSSAANAGSPRSATSNAGFPFLGGLRSRKEEWCALQRRPFFRPPTSPARG
jgi:hypothetical protein